MVGRPACICAMGPSSGSAHTGRVSRGIHPTCSCSTTYLTTQLLDRAQREVTRRYFLGTLMPMLPGQIVLIGTAIHRADLLVPRQGMGQGRDPAPHPAQVSAESYRALDEESGEALWPQGSQGLSSCPPRRRPVGLQPRVPERPAR